MSAFKQKWKLLNLFRLSGTPPPTNIYHHPLGPATATFINYAAFVPTLISKQQTPLPLLLYIPNSTTWTVYFNHPKTQITDFSTSRTPLLTPSHANTPKYSHTTSVLESLHRLKIEECIQHKTDFSYKVITVNLPTYAILSLFKLTIILVPLMSHLLVHPPPLKITDLSFSMPCLISGINFLLHFVNQFHFFMLISTHPSLFHFLRSSPLHSKLKTYLFGKSFLP